MGWRTKRKIEAIELKPGRSTANYSEVADDFLVNAVEDEGGARITTGFAASEMTANVETLNGHPNGEAR